MSITRCIFMSLYFVYLVVVDLFKLILLVMISTVLYIAVHIMIVCVFAKTFIKSGKDY